MHLIILRHNWLLIYLLSHRHRACAWQWRPSVNQLLIGMINYVSIGTLIIPVGSKRGYFPLSEQGAAPCSGGGAFLKSSFTSFGTKFKNIFHHFLLLGINPILHFHPGGRESQLHFACVFSKAKQCPEERAATEHNNSKCIQRNRKKQTEVGDLIEYAKIHELT